MVTIGFILSLEAINGQKNRSTGKAALYRETQSCIMQEQRGRKLYWNLRLSKTSFRCLAM